MVLCSYVSGIADSTALRAIAISINIINDK